MLSFSWAAMEGRMITRAFVVPSRVATYAETPGAADRLENFDFRYSVEVDHKVEGPI